MNERSTCSSWLYEFEFGEEADVLIIRSLGRDAVIDAQYEHVVPGRAQVHADAAGYLVQSRAGVLGDKFENDVPVLVLIQPRPGPGDCAEHEEAEEHVHDDGYGEPRGGVYFCGGYLAVVGAVE